jgi:hypothetical protein
MLGEAKAEQRQKDLTALERERAAKGTALSGGRLIAEMDIVFGGFESTVETLIEYRRQLAVKAPELLLAAHLKDFQAKLDHHIDLALDVLQRRYENSSLKALPSISIDAALKRARMRADVFKGKLNNQIQAMALEGALGMHRENERKVTLNISNSQIANLNLDRVIGDLNGSIQILTSAGQSELVDAVKQLTEAIGASALADKKEMLENLAHVSQQAALPAESRKMGTVKASLAAIKTGVGTTANLLGLFLKVVEALKDTGILHA